LTARRSYFRYSAASKANPPCPPFAKWGDPVSGDLGVRAKVLSGKALPQAGLVAYRDSLKFAEKKGSQRLPHFYCGIKVINKGFICKPQIKIGSSTKHIIAIIRTQAA
jgi:hypothetical protein